MDEFALIKELFRPLAGEGALDLVDDAACLTPPSGKDLVLTKDTIVEGVHFRSEDPAGRVAQKLARVNLSDLAAKGAVPLGYLLSTAFGTGVDLNWMKEFAAGLAMDQEEFGWSLLGGDTVRTPGPSVFSLTAIGTVDQGTMIKRSGARAGDELYVTGSIGDGGLGLKVLGGDTSVDDTDRAFLTERYQVPQPRTTVGPRLSGVAHASIDVSDGLLADAGHMAEASRVGIEIDLDAVPLSPAAHTLVEAGKVTREALVSAGDDYELLIAVGAVEADRLAGIAGETGVAISQVGRVTAGSGVRALDAGGAEIAIETKGYNHFSK